MRRICLQGTAHGVWKDMAVSVVAGREETWVLKSESDVMSAIFDMVEVRKI